MPAIQQTGLYVTAVFSISNVSHGFVHSFGLAQLGHRLGCVLIHWIAPMMYEKPQMWEKKFQRVAD